MNTFNDPLVSVGIPVYNGQKTIDKILKSIINQSYKNLEIVISDNNSSDKTYEICKKYEKKDPRINLQKQINNIGVANNFNFVFKKSSGKYFMWAAVDDYFDKDFILLNLNNLEKNSNAVLSQTKTKLFIDGYDDVIAISSLASFKNKKSILSLYKESLYNFPATAIYGLFRSEKLNKTSLWRNTFSGDLIFIQEMCFHGEFIEVNNECYFNYVSRNKWKTKQEDYFDFYNKNKLPFMYSPFFKIIYFHILNINNSKLSMNLKINLYFVILSYFIYKFFIRLFLKFNKNIVPKKYKTKLGMIIYKSLILNKNIKILNSDIYLKRFIIPQIFN